MYILNITYTPKISQKIAYSVQLFFFNKKMDIFRTFPDTIPKACIEICVRDKLC